MSILAANPCHNKAPTIFTAQSVDDISRIKQPNDGDIVVIITPETAADFWVFDADYDGEIDGFSAIAGGCQGAWRHSDAEVNVLLFGATGDGETDDSAAFQSAADAAGAQRPILVPYSPNGYRVSNWQPGLSQVVIFVNALLEAAVVNQPIINILRSDVRFEGELRLDGRSLAGVVGLQLGGGAFTVQQCYFENILTQNCVIGLYLYGLADVILNHFEVVTSKANSRNIVLESPVGVHHVNANSFVTVYSQQCTSTALEVTRADGNYIMKYEAESNAGTAVVLTATVGFGIGRFWIEGNTMNFVADNATTGVDMAGDADTDFTSTDVKVSFTRTGIDRTIKLGLQATTYIYGVIRNAGVWRMGLNGAVANNQSVIPLEISGGMTLYDYSAGTPRFIFAGQGNGMLFQIPTTGQIADMSASGFIPPMMTSAVRDAFGAVANGRIIYNTDTDKFQGRAAAAWVDFH